MRPEARFITLCVREPACVSGATLAAAAHAVTDWATVVDLAARHRVSAYVLRAEVDMPDATREQLRTEVFSTQAVAMLLLRELERLAGALAEANVPVLVLKGPALVRWLYADLALRPFADLDLLVQREHVATAANVLSAAGYAEFFYDGDDVRHAAANHFHEAGEYHRSFAGLANRALVELHLDPLQLGINAECEAGRWARAVPLGDLPHARCLGIEDQVVQLSVHAHKHGFNRLIWLKDLDLLLRACGDQLNWRLVADVARQEGVGSSVWYALELARAVLGTPIPRDAVGVRPGPMVRWMYRAMWPVPRVASLDGFVRRRAVQLFLDEGLWGMLPSLVFMGRRQVRLRLLLASARRR